MTNVQKYIAELLGTLVIVFLGTAAIITTAANPLVVALTFGLAWAGMWWVFGNVSGGHFNPAITLASTVAKRTSTKDFVPYVVCQIIGGVVGSALLWVTLRGVTLPGDMGMLAASLAAPTMATGWNMTSVILIELFVTAFLCLVWMAATEKTGASGITGLGIGLAYAGMLFACLGVTWSALNPARTLGPALLANTGFGNIYVMWIGPLVGAIIGAGIWMAVVAPARTSAPSRYTSEA